MHQRDPLASAIVGAAKRERLNVDWPQRIEAEARACRLCVDQPQGRALPHPPRPVFMLSQTATVLIAGQAPGTKVHASGVPFTDRSGDRLRQWMGVTSEEFYDPRHFAILPMGFCFPGQDAKGGDLPPRRECAPAWRARLLAVMPQIEFVLAVGMYAQAWHLRDRAGASLTQTVRNWRAGLEGGEARIIPLPHPSWRNTGWIRQNPWFEAELLPFLQSAIRRRLDRHTALSAHN